MSGTTTHVYSEELNQAPATAIPKSDRRRSQREALAASAWVSAEPGSRGKSRQVTVLDLSLHGVGFSSSDKFDAGSIHWIVLGTGGLRASSRLRVISCRQREDGAFDCGAEFF
ncbi:MAG: PilZ domain-containing protein [Tepidisphaeraceae bacterium]|jgi:hypothetical protein